MPSRPTLDSADPRAPWAGTRDPATCPEARYPVSSRPPGVHIEPTPGIDGRCFFEEVTYDGRQLATGRLGPILLSGDAVEMMRMALEATNTVLRSQCDACGACRWGQPVVEHPSGLRLHR